MRLDKDTLIRQRFWFLLVVFVPLVLASVLLLWMQVGSAVAKQVDKITKAKQDLNSLPSPLKNRNWLTVLETRYQEAEKKKKEIWKQAWDTQVAFMTWPEGLADDLNGKEFGSDISPQTCYVYATEKYLPEVWKTANMLEPAPVWTPVNELVPERAKDNLVVQFLGGPESVLQYVKDKPWKQINPPPTSEDLWLAQEDLWVQKGLLLAIKDANDSVATFGRLDKKLEGTIPEAKGGSFANSDWRLDLTLESGKLMPKLTNVSSRKLSLGLRFRISFPDERSIPETLVADGEPLGPSESRDLPPKVLTQAPSGVKGVEMVQEWRNVAVKRVDKIELYRQSHRTNVRDLVKDSVFEPKTTDASGAPIPVTAGTASGMGSGSGSAMGGGSGSMGGGAGGAAANDLTPNGFKRSRYLDVTQAVRRMPIGVVVVADQAHVQDVLTAFANSNLRIQITQVGWQHYRGPSLKPVKLEEMTDAGPGKVMPGGMRPGGSGSAPPKMMGTGGPGFTPGGIAPAADEQASDVVELAIYGIATLYQMYPKAETAADAGAGGTAAPATTAATGGK